MAFELRTRRILDRAVPGQPNPAVCNDVPVARPPRPGRSTATQLVHETAEIPVSPLVKYGLLWPASFYDTYRRRRGLAARSGDEKPAQPRPGQARGGQKEKRAWPGLAGQGEVFY